MKKLDMERLRELAFRVRQISDMPIQNERKEMWRRVNGLEGGKPVVFIRDYPWEQMEHGDELKNEIEDEFLKKFETELLRKLYQWKHIPGDMVVEPVVYNPIIFESSGFGISENAEELGREIFTAKRFVRVLDNEEDLEKIKIPDITVDWQMTENNNKLLNEIFDGILDVQNRGVPCAGFSPWDTLMKWFGIQQGFLDLALNPEFMHKAIKKLTEVQTGLLKRYEELGLLSPNSNNTTIGNGGLGYTKELPRVGDNVKLSDTWGYCQNQIFTSVSPDMQDEFAIGYEKTWMEMFGLTYYGCCEALDKKIHVLRKIKNLRKISISPFANMAEGMEAIGKDYVVSFKPNSNILAAETWEPEAARKELEEACKKAEYYGCSMEILMKTIITIRNQPSRLWEWAEIASEVTGRYS